MRRLAFLIVPAVLLLGCSGDDDSSGDGTIAEQLGDDPSFDECIASAKQVLESIKVPDGVDASDGIDAEEQPAAQAAVDKAFSDAGLDVEGEDDPCSDHVGEEADAAIAEIVADLDPDVQAMLGMAAG